MGIGLLLRFAFDFQSEKNQQLYFPELFSKSASKFIQTQTMRFKSYHNVCDFENQGNHVII